MNRVFRDRCFPGQVHLVHFVVLSGAASFEFQGAVFDFFSDTQNSFVLSLQAFCVFAILFGLTQRI